MNYKVSELCIIYDVQNLSENFLKKKYINNYEYKNFHSIYKPKLLTIQEYANKYNYELNCDIWVEDIWEPILNRKFIIVTSDVLNFFNTFFDNKNYITEQKFLQSLKFNNIEHLSIFYDNILDPYYKKVILKDIKTNNIKISKKWIVISVRNFKKFIMNLSKKYTNIKEYYIQLEDIIYGYSRHIMEYHIKKQNINHKIHLIKLKNHIIEKNQEINRLNTSLFYQNL